MVYGEAYGVLLRQSISNEGIAHNLLAFDRNEVVGLHEHISAYTSSQFGWKFLTIGLLRSAISSLAPL